MLSEDALTAIVGEVLGVAPPLTRSMSASDVNGWDSLSNTLIALEISARYGIEFDGATAAKAKNIGELLDRVNSLIVQPPVARP